MQSPVWRYIIASQRNWLATLEFVEGGAILDGRTVREMASKRGNMDQSSSMSEDWTIEDEQCQRIGGGYEAVNFRFLLFL